MSSLKSKIVAVAAANKHTAVVSDSGEVFTWGCNKEGQLGYGTSKSASNYAPRVVESLNGKVLVAVAAAKYHTIVLGADGEVMAVMPLPVRPFIHAIMQHRLEFAISLQRLILTKLVGFHLGSSPRYTKTCSRS